MVLKRATRTTRAEARPTGVKVSVTVDPELLATVDRWLLEHPDQDRSKIFDEALHLWYARQQELAMEAQFSAPVDDVEREERATWRRIAAAAVERRFRS